MVKQTSVQFGWKTYWHYWQVIKLLTILDFNRPKWLLGGLRVFLRRHWPLHTLYGLAERRANSIQVFNSVVLQIAALQMLPLDNGITTSCSLEGRELWSDASLSGSRVPYQHHHHRACKYLAWTQWQKDPSSFELCTCATCWANVLR